MNDNTNKASSVVAKILRETQEGSIKWSISHNDGSDIQQDDDTRIIGNIYIAKVANKDIRLSQLKKRYVLPNYDLANRSASVYINPKEPSYGWSTSFRLEFYNVSTKRSEWIFPSTNAISDLYEVVCKKTSGVDDFFSQYLNEE